MIFLKYYTNSMFRYSAKKGTFYMYSNFYISQKSKSVEDFTLKYALSQRRETIEDTVLTVFDIAVYKTYNNTITNVVCPSVTSNLECACNILDVLYNNDVFPETLLETLEDYLECIHA